MCHLSQLTLVVTSTLPDVHPLPPSPGLSSIFTDSAFPSLLLLLGCSCAFWTLSVSYPSLWVCTPQVGWVQSDAAGRLAEPWVHPWLAVSSVHKRDGRFQVALKKKRVAQNQSAGMTTEEGHGMMSTKKLWWMREAADLQQKLGFKYKKRPIYKWFML